MIIKYLKKKLSKVLRRIFAEEYEKKLLIKGKLLSLKHKKKKKIKNLADIEFRVFSQWGEDGIIDWIISQFKKIPKNFLEIGTEDYRESNTRFLLINKNWDGHLIDCDKNAIKNIKSQRIFWKHNLKATDAFLTTKNVNRIISRLKLPKMIGIISIDIDGIDYWILKKIKNLKPAIFICEYNGIFGKLRKVSVPNKDYFSRGEEHYSNLYYGASIKAFQDLLKNDYFFLGTNSAGNNAFFVKKNYRNIFKNKIKDYKIFNTKFRESRNRNKKLNFLNIDKAKWLLRNKEVVNLDNNKKIKLKEIKL
jgi:hypothetical protein